MLNLFHDLHLTISYRSITEGGGGNQYISRFVQRDITALYHWATPDPYTGPLQKFSIVQVTCILIAIDRLT